MDTNLRPLPPPLKHGVVASDGLVERPWADFFNNCYRYQNPGWKDINLGGVQLIKGATAPDNVSVNGTSILAYAFDGATLTEEAHGAFELQHDYKEGTDLYPHIHWYPSNTGTGNVKWQLEYWIVGGTVSSTATLTGIGAATGTAWQKVDTEFTTIVGSSFSIGLQIHFRLFRDPTDAADTYASDAVLGTVGVHYQCDTFGSSGVTDK